MSHDSGDRKETYVTDELSTRPRSWALIVCSAVLIALSIPAAIYEFSNALAGVSSSDAWYSVESLIGRSSSVCQPSRPS